MSSSYSLAIMPKPKPDQVIRHEIALSRPMQETLDSYVATAQFKNIADPTVKLLNDVTGTATVLSLLGTLGLTGVYFTYIYGGEDSVLDVFNNWVAQRASALAEKSGLNDVFAPIRPDGPIRNPKASGPLEIFLAQLANTIT